MSGAVRGLALKMSKVGSFKNVCHITVWARLPITHSGRYTRSKPKPHTLHPVTITITSQGTVEHGKC